MWREFEASPSFLEDGILKMLSSLVLQHEIQAEDCSAKCRACSTIDSMAMRRLRTKSNQTSSPNRDGIFRCFQTWALSHG